MAPRLTDLENRIGHTFAEPRWLELALRHRSAGGENNERLEFLGDSVLNCLIAAKLFTLRPDLSEGELSRLRAALVRGTTLAELADEIGLSAFLVMGAGELRSGGFQRQSTLADALEAVLGAVYLDAGFDACDTVIETLYRNRLDELPDAEALKDPKTRLQEWLQKRGVALPDYELLRSSGKDHARVFDVACRVAAYNVDVASQGASRRKAEQSAAEAALALLTAKKA